MDIEKVRSRFIKHFDGKTGNIDMSPGRINPIGQHTDYNGGFVFPGAVDKGIMADNRPNGNRDSDALTYRPEGPCRVQGKRPRGYLSYHGTLHLRYLPGDEGPGC